MNGSSRNLVGPVVSHRPPLRWDTAQDVVKTVHEAFSITNKSCGDVSDVIREAKNVNKSISTSSRSELERDLAFSFAATHAVSIA
jgi:hypothetical protein